MPLIISVLISVTGAFNAGLKTPECEDYRAQMRAIDAANRAALLLGKLLLKQVVAFSALLIPQRIFLGLVLLVSFV